MPWDVALLVFFAVTSLLSLFGTWAFMQGWKAHKESLFDQEDE
jgi:hypothetical protein